MSDEESRVHFYLQSIQNALERKATLKPWQRNLQEAAEAIGIRAVDVLLNDYIELASADSLRQAGFNVEPRNAQAKRQEKREEMEDELGEVLAQFFTGSIDSTISNIMGSMN